MAFDPNAYIAEKTAAAPTPPVPTPPVPTPPVPTPAAAAPASSAAAAASTPFDPDLYLKQKASGSFASIPGQLEEVKTQEAGRAQGIDPAIGAFARKNTRPGIPFDPTEPLPAAIRARVSVEDDPQKQAELLAKQPGIVEARNVGGKVIATVKDDKGTRDVLLHPANFTDIAGGAAPAVKTAAAIGLGLVAPESLPATAATIGTGLGLTDLLLKGGSRLESGQPLDVPDLAKSAGKEAIINAALPIGGALVQKGAQTAFRSGIGPLERDVAGAAERLGVPLSSAQATGSPILARSAALPGTGGKALAADQQGALRASIDRQTGLSGPNAVPSETTVAGRIQPVVEANATAAQGGATAAMRDSATAAQKEIQAQLDKGLVPSNLSNSDAGAFIRQKIVAARDAFQAAAQKNYAAAYQQAEKEGIAVPIEPLQKLSAEISAKDPQGLTQQLVPEIGRIFKLSAQAEVPTGVTVGRAPGLTLPQAVELRALVNDKITRGEAVGDIPGRYLKQLAAALSDGIEQGVKTGSPELQKLYNTAKTSYAQDIGKFTSSDIGKLFKETEASAHLGDSEVIPTLFRGSGNLDALHAYRDVLGAASPEYKLLLRQGANHLLDEAGTTGGLLDAGALLKRLDGLSPEMRSELLGPSAKAITDNARIMAVARGAKIDSEDLAQALAAAPGQAPKLFQQAVARQEAVDQQYATSVMKGIRNGTFGDESVLANPDTFVTRFLTKASAADVEKVMAQLGDKTNEMLRQRTLTNLLGDVRVKPPVGQMTTGTSLAFDPDKLVQNYLTGPNRTKYEAVLGKKGVQFLDDLATFQEAQLKEQLQSRGSALSSVNKAAYLAGDIAPGERGPVRTATRFALLAPEFALGNAQRSAAVRQFLATGELPSLGTVGRAVRGAVLAAPEAAEQTHRVLSQQPNGPPPLVRRDQQRQVKTQAKAAPKAPQGVESEQPNSLVPVGK